MTTKLTKLEHDCSTGITREVELTTAEIAELDQLRAKAEEENRKLDAERKALAEAKASALAKLQELGLTEEEAISLIP